MLTILNEHKGFFIQIYTLAKYDLKKDYQGSLLGPLWLLVRPMCTFLVYWFAMLIGLRASKAVNGVPRFDFMVAGFIPWFFISDSIRSGAKSIQKYSVYVTKITFPVSTIGTFVTLSCFMIHLLLVVFMYIYMLIKGYAPSVYNLQLLFYAPFMCLFFTVLSWATGTVSAFSKDFLNMINSIMIGLFWFSGIVWDVRDLQNIWLKRLMILNPINLFVTGYRNSLIYNRWFWENPMDIICVLIEFIVLLLISSNLYRKNRPYMSDVL